MANDTDPVEQLWPNVLFTTMERAFMQYLLRCDGGPVPTGELLREVWGYGSSTRTSTVKTTVHRIRGKIEGDSKAPQRLIYVHQRGYRLVGLEPQAKPASSPRNTSTPEDLFGRDPDLNAVTEWLTTGKRIVTLRGVAGVGKTRLARELIPRCRHAFQTIAFVELAAARSSTDLALAVADEMGMTLPQSATPIEPLAERLLLRPKTLLILDNFEQLPASAAEALSKLVQAVNDLTVLVTSRHPLGVPNEWVFDLSPLAPPDAARLLLTRIVQADHRIQLAADNPELERVAQLLDGIPLALEMAAGRAPLMPLAVLRARLESSFTSLAFSETTRTDRQQSWHSAVAWSWQLLSDDEQDALCLLAIFRGGAALDAVEPLLEGTKPALSVLGSLVNKSMAWPERTGTGRLHVFESVREFVIANAGPRLRKAQQRHAAWAMEACVQPSTAGIDSDNLVHAAQFLLSEADVRAFPLLKANQEGVRRYGNPRPQIQLLRTSRVALAMDSSHAARVGLWLAENHTWCGEMEQADSEVDRALTRVQQGTELEVLLLMRKSSVLQGMGAHETALEFAQQAVDTAETAGHSSLLPVVHSNLGSALLMTNRRDESAHSFRVAIARYQDDQRPLDAANTWANLGAVLSDQGDLPAALECLTTARTLAEQAEDTFTLHSTNMFLATVYARLGRLSQANLLYRQLLDEEECMGTKLTVGATRVNAGIVAVLVGEPTRALAILRQARRMLGTKGKLSDVGTVCDVYQLICHAGLDECVAADLIATRLRGLPAQPASVSGEIELALGHLDVARAVAETQAGRDLEAKLHWQAANARIEAFSDCDGDLQISRKLLERTLHDRKTALNS
ncbi:MAG: tetratricopeptide (TPR) repeat protein/DNA-binding winged helix-turn-helix (wHTH) protein [Myxococcota bacterium]|jgi:tetratricopeptide (TPR) repeat protein/DNA-binding winged helix-turn-helix (wHTH) protein